ncbi:SseB protein N-terminal domain-containing protein [Clostridium acidisoli DSM 12555]|uniref:SseB protein N-terminal domain-containing protein n=1 Tax=Clostridium acidisoli DSM 12555 TaxID=1121291 RepID=A0A1W1Y0G4_9CLOT|nr:enhanced serine sensitivity protein SseB [Clostridium acidisoli]SMC29646.1 SseB protein N-terminal domain-containing protein [Clostridium acidisoli DSM 12555]
MDINKPVTNKKLVEIMQKIKNDKSRETEFLDELLKAKFLCPVLMNLKSNSKSNRGKIILNEGTTINLSSISSKNGMNYLMAFTDWTELSKWKSQPNQQTLILSYNDYQAIILKDDSTYEGFVINPYGENIVLEKNLIQNITQRFEKIKKGESVMIGLPKEYPFDMVQQMIIHFDNIKVVKAAYLLWMARGDESSYLLVLDIVGIPHNVFPQIADVCKPYLKGKLLDMIPMNTAFGKNAIENQQPFYQA